MTGRDLSAAYRARLSLHPGIIPTCPSQRSVKRLETISLRKRVLCFCTACTCIMIHPCTKVAVMRNYALGIYLNATIDSCATVRTRMFSLTRTCSARDKRSSSLTLSGCTPLAAASAFMFNPTSSSGSREDVSSSSTLPGTLTNQIKGLRDKKTSRWTCNDREQQTEAISAYPQCQSTVFESLKHAFK